ncbi:MAG: PAC2 family protein [Dehalococcoidia bacterium]|nr:PAC2 family protein [Dehalococcoidia bacterium]
MRKRGEGIVKIYSEPKLTHPSLVAAWPGIANVALIAANYLSEKLGAKEFAEIEPSSFFDLNGTFVEKNLIQLPRLPQSKFHYWKREDAGADLIIFIGEAQPAARSYEFAKQILGFAQRLGVTEVYTFAAAVVPEFAEQPRVWAATTDSGLLSELEAQGLVLKGNFYIAGMNGLLLSVAKESDLKGICLLGESPRYLSEVGNPVASKSVLEILTRILKIDIDMTELDNMAEEARQEIAEAVKESRRQYIDHFTVPLWERPEEEETG